MDYETWSQKQRQILVVGSCVFIWYLLACIPQVNKNSFKCSLLGFFFFIVYFDGLVALGAFLLKNWSLISRLNAV